MRAGGEGRDGMDRYTGSGGTSQTQLADRLQRLRRVLGVVGGRVRALRADHAPFWDVPAAHWPALGGDLAGRVTLFTRKVDLALRLLEQGEALVEEVALLQPSAALVATGRFDPLILANAARELDAMTADVQVAAKAFWARKLGPNARPAPTSRPAPARAPAPAPTPGLVPRLQAVWSQTNRPAGALPAPRDPHESYVAELASTCKSVREVLEDIVTELEILRAALDGTALPVPRRAWPEVPEALASAARSARFSPQQTSWLTPVAKQIYGDDLAMKKAHVTITQWRQVDDMLSSAEGIRRAVGTMPAERRTTVMQGFPPGRLRAAALPLTRVHVTFAETPVLTRLFPPPEDD